MKNLIQTEIPRRLTKLFATLGLAALAVPTAFGASATWTNAPADATWTNVLNWQGQTVPGTINNTGNNGIDGTSIATFTNAITTYGGAANPIIPDDATVVNGKARMIAGVTFDGPNCGPYTFYSPSSFAAPTATTPETGVLSFCVTAASASKISTNMSMITGPVTQPQNFLIPVQLRLPSSDDGVYFFSNGATASAATFYFNNLFIYPGATGRGVLFDFTGPNTGTNTVALLNCNASTAGTCGIRKEGTGRWILSGSDSLPSAATVSILGGTLEVQNSAAFGNMTGLPLVTNATLQIDGTTLSQNFISLNNGGIIQANGTSGINGISVGNQPATSVTVATTTATDVLTIGSGGNQFKGGALDTIIHLAGPGTNLLNSDFNTLTNGTWSIDAGVAQMGSGNALGATPKTLTFGSGSTGVLLMNGNSYAALAVTSSPTAGTPIIENGGNNTSVLTVSNASANTFAGALQDGAGSGNLALTKAALGTLTLSGASTYTGNTTINNGTLNVSGSLGNTAVTVNSGATLAGSGSISGSVSLSSGGTILPGGNASVGSLTVGSLSMSSGSSGSFDFNGTTNDLVAVTTSGGLTLGGGSVNLYQADGVTPFAAAGSYNLIQYSGSLGGTAGNLTIGDPQAGYAYAFAASGGYITVTITTAGVNTAWNVDADGNWSTGANWSGGTVPHSAGDSAKLGVGTALRTVTLDANETVGGLTFTNNNSFVVANAGNTLTLDNKGAGAPLTIQAGTANAIQTAVSLNDNVTANVGSGKTLSVSGNVSATANQTLAVIGAGTLALSGNNSYGPSSSGSFGTTLSGGGTLSVGNNNALGAGDVNVAGNNTVQAGAPTLNVANNVTVQNLITATVNTGGNTFTLSGIIGGSGAITKNGAGTLVLSGNNAYNGIATVNSGVLSISQDGNLGYGSGSEAIDILLNGGDLLGSANITLSSQRDIGIGPVSGSVGTNALIDAAAGTELQIYGSIYTAGNTGVNGLQVNTGSGNTGTIFLANANAFNGPTYIAQGILQLAAPLALQNSVLDYTNGTLVFDSSITAATMAEIAGPQNLALTNLNNQGVTLTLGGDNASVTYAASFTDSGLGGALTKTGSGTMTLGGTNSLAGALNVGAGEVLIPTNGVSVLGAVGVTGTTVPLLLINGGSLTATNLTVAASGSGGPGNLVISSGTASFGGTVLVNAGTSENSVNCGITVNTNGSFYASTLTMGRGGLTATTQPGAGQAGEGLILNGGTAIITNNLTMGPSGANSGTSMIVSNGTLTVGGSLTFGCNDTGHSRWSVVDIAGGTLNVADTNTGVRLSSGTANDGGGEVFLVRGGTANAGIITFGNTNSTASTVNPTESTVVNVTGGALYVGAGGMVQAWTNVVPSVTLNGGILGATANWSGSNAMTLGGGTIQTADAGGAAYNITWTGPIGGATNLIKTGSGTLTLTAGNFFTGGATLGAGTLNINGSWALGGAVYGGLTFTGGTLQFAPAFSGNGPGDFSENTAATPAQVPVTFTANATIDLNGNPVACAYGVGNGGSGGLIVKDSIGGGVLNLQGTNSYSGNTTVQSGTLALGVASINSSSTVSIASGAMMQLNFAGNNTVASLLLNGVAQAPGTYNSTTTPAYFTAGTGSLVVAATGPGTFTATPGINHFALSGANVVFNGTNGQANDAYYLLAGTNLTQPFSLWRTVATNVFSSSGNFTFIGTNAVTAGSPQQFYILSNTNYNH